MLARTLCLVAIQVVAHSFVQHGLKLAALRLELCSKVVDEQLMEAAYS